MSSYTMSDDKIKKIELHFREIFNILNLKEIDDSSTRVAKMWVNELFYGLNEENFPKCTTFKNNFNFKQPIIYKNISVQSTCEHHFLPFFGSANISYIPKDKILGLSKFNRIVDFYSKKPQLQERLTIEIFNKLSEILETDNILVSIKCLHLCVRSRGIQDSNSILITNQGSGLFMKDRAIFDSVVFKE